MKHMLMSLIALIGLVISLTGQGLPDYQKTLDEIRINYAPDKRVAIYTAQAQFNHDTLYVNGETDQPLALQKIAQYLKTIAIPSVNQITLLPAPTLGEKTYGIVRLSSVTIHGKPDVTVELSSQAIMGTPVKILKSEDGYFMIQTPDAYIGWAEGSAFQRITPAEYQVYQESALLMYMRRIGWIYQAPDTQSPVVTDIVIGSLVTPDGQTNGWYEVKIPDGRCGYIPAGEVVDYQSWKKHTRPTRDGVIQTAKLFMGVPYLWGGNSAKMLDCSGFAQTSYKLNNYLLPRDASQQCFVGDSIPITPDFKDAKPADLLFFGRYDSLRQREYITHVGIYLGNYAFIHEATDVHINSLHPDSANFSEYRLHQLRKIKRIIKD